MTGLDHREGLAGYFGSAWPAECGGPRRQKIVSSPGLGLGEGDRLVSTVRDTGGWAVMVIQRGPGELYLLCGAGLQRGEFPPTYRPSDDAGWVERIDPITLETLQRSSDLPSGGWLWCGALVAHANGDLYVVNGAFAHRLDAECNVRLELELPTDSPHNGLLIMSDGNLVTRNLGFRDGDSARFVVLDPDLEPVGEPLEIDARCMGRFSSDRTSDGEFVYTTTPEEVRRLEYRDGRLRLDPLWRRRYAIDGEDQSDAWDTSIGDDSVWLMDMGRPPGWMPPGTAAQRAFRFSINDATSTEVIAALDASFAWNPGPPLYDPLRAVLVHYDAFNGGVIAHRVRAGREPRMLWRSSARNFVQMMVYADTGELVIEDASLPRVFGGDTDTSEVVVLDIETGHELGRVETGAASLGMFCCPGFERDLYMASLPGALTRIAVA